MACQIQQKDQAGVASGLAIYNFEEHMPDTLCSNRTCFLATRCQRWSTNYFDAQKCSKFEPVLIELPTAAHWHCDHFRPLWAPRHIKAADARAAAR